FLYEQYVDEAGYQAHQDSEHFTRLVKQEAIPELLAERERAFYTTIDDDRGGLAGGACAAPSTSASGDDALPPAGQHGGRALGARGRGRRRTSARRRHRP